MKIKIKTKIKEVGLTEEVEVAAIEKIEDK
jgi:hypothetical protein